MRNPIRGGEMRETKQENTKGRRHSVFLLVPGRRIQGSNNLCVCVCARGCACILETGAIARGRSWRGERGGARRREKFSKR